MERFVIFDLDGTLVETEEIWEDVRRRFAITHGGRWRDDAQTTMIGMRTTEWAQYIHGDLAVPLSTDVIARDVIDGVVKRMNKHTFPSSRVQTRRSNVYRATSTWRLRHRRHFRWQRRFSRVPAGMRSSRSSCPRTQSNAESRRRTSIFAHLIYSAQMQKRRPPLKIPQTEFVPLVPHI